MDTLNRISNHPLFTATLLRTEFEKYPIGFIDVGSAGGVHSMVRPIASLVSCLCFEPNRKEMTSLYSRKEKDDFSGFTVYDLAVAGQNASMKLYITRSEVNSSLLRPEAEFARRYGMNGFDVIREIAVQSQTLDHIVAKASTEHLCPGEFIKLDCQGAEYEILEGAKETLAHRCRAIWCEVEFCQIYKGQKVFADIDRLLNSKGFVLHGLYPNYISTKVLNRRRRETNERLMWADALYFKDPLEPGNSGYKVSRRDFAVLFLTSLTTGYYDYACELIKEFAKVEEKMELLKLTDRLAEEDQESLADKARDLSEAIRREPDLSYLLAKKFIDVNKGNNNIDFIPINQLNG